MRTTVFLLACAACGVFCAAQVVVAALSLARLDAFYWFMGLTSLLAGWKSVDLARRAARWYDEEAR